jgi:hypothetical protein
MRIHRRSAPVSAESKRPRAVLAAAALLVLVIVALWSSRRAETATLARSVIDDEPSSPEEPRSVASTAAPAVVATPGRGEPAPIIDDIVLEKSEVCAGEENLVTVRAHTANATDSSLHYSLDGEGGASVPITLWLNDDGSVAGNHFVSVFGRMNASTSVPLPSYRVRDCQPRRTLHVSAALQANTFDLFDLQAMIVNLPSPARRMASVGPIEFKPRTYEWSFGDGERATTTVPLVSHDYGGRPQKADFASFVVRVDVRGSDGDVLTGRKALTLPNPGFRDLSQKGIVGLMISLDPRFPKADENGRVEQKVRLWHIMPAPVTIEHATMTAFYRGGVGQSPPKDIPVERVLGATRIPPGKDGIVTVAALDTTADPDVFSITYNLTGTSADDHPVMGAFSVMAPPPKPTAANSRPLNDPVLKAKVIAARRILGKDVVNAEELKQLDRQGAFAELPTQAPAADGAPEVTARPSPRAAPAAPP